MNNRSSSSLPRRAAGIDSLPPLATRSLTAAGCLLLVLLAAPAASAGDAPAWMHALVNAPLPAHDEKTNAVLLYSEQTVTVRSADKITTVVREAYKILRPGGRDYGIVKVYFDPQTRISYIHAWCIPAQGKDYEVKDKDAVDVSLPDISGSELVGDDRVKLLRIPASEPGNIVGFEYEHDDRPFFLQDIWYFQERIPVREARYSLQLPSGWEYKSTWLNAPEIAPSPGPNNQWTWAVTNVKPLKDEDAMPPRHGIEGQMLVNFLPPAGAQASARLSDWNGIGAWYDGLLRGRTEASPQLKQEVEALTSSQSTLLAKMEAIASYLQRDVRYVAIELGIGGWQPHPAAEVFTHSYGDCKDKVTLMRSMLREIGVDSYHLVINSTRGSVTPAMPGHIGAFDHVVVAIQLPDDLTDSSLVAIYQHPKLGRLLIFDPTDDLTPLGSMRGALQQSYALLVTPEGGELIETPTLPSYANGIHRLARLTLDAQGNLAGQVEEIRLGDFAAEQRDSLRSVNQASDRIKPVETLLSHSMASFRLLKATVTNLEAIDFPIKFDFSFVAPNYAKKAGNLLLVRPRVLGSRSSAVLETKEPREQPVVFEGLAKHVDTFEITLPQGFVVDDLPAPLDLDYSFASYHSKSEVKGNVLRYTRTYEQKELSVPLAKVEVLRTFYRAINNDERNTAVIKPAP